MNTPNPAEAILRDYIGGLVMQMAALQGELNKIKLSELPKSSSELPQQESS